MLGVTLGSFDILGTLAEVAATIIGFTGVVFAIGQFSSGGITATQRMGIVHLLVPASISLFLALLPLVLLYAVKESPAFWQYLNLLVGLIHTVGIADASLRIFRRQALDPIQLQIALLLVAYLLILTNFAIAAGYLSNLAVAIYIGSICWLLFISVLQFVLLILSHNKEESGSL